MVHNFGRRANTPTKRRQAECRQAAPHEYSPPPFPPPSIRAGIPRASMDQYSVVFGFLNSAVIGLIAAHGARTMMRFDRAASSISHSKSRSSHRPRLRQFGPGPFLAPTAEPATGAHPSP